MLIVANFKANKTVNEVLEWVNAVDRETRNLSHEIVIAPAFPHLFPLKQKLENLDSKLKLCSQTVSNFEKGQYTGEVTAPMLEGLVDYCLVGHSERRKYFSETTDDVILKVKELEGHHIKPIICAAQKEEIPRITKDLDPASYVLMYEPPEAISVNGIYRPHKPDQVQKEITGWKENLNPPCRILYGGSVNPENAKALSRVVDGFVIGHASLNVNEFLSLMENLSR